MEGMPLPFSSRVWMGLVGSEASLDPYMLAAKTRNWYCLPSVRSNTA